MGKRETNGSISNSYDSQHSNASDSTNKEKPSEKVVFINRGVSLSRLSILFSSTLLLIQTQSASL